MPDDIQPVIDPAESKAALSPRLHFLTHAVRVSAGLACLAAVSISVYYFLGFAENDERAAHLMNAYIICFGIGSLFFVPAFFVGRKAHLVLTQGLPKGVTFGIFALMLPWAFMGLYFQALGAPWNIIGGVLMFLVFKFIFWGGAISKAIKNEDA